MDSGSPCCSCNGVASDSSGWRFLLQMFPWLHSRNWGFKSNWIDLIRASIIKMMVPAYPFDIWIWDFLMREMKVRVLFIHEIGIFNSLSRIPNKHCLISCTANWMIHSAMGVHRIDSDRSHRPDQKAGLAGFDPGSNIKSAHCVGPG